MAFNSYDKLVKAQRDYPKPKFATQVVDKALKSFGVDILMTYRHGKEISHFNKILATYIVLSRI
jgi:hypothetical protein